MSDDTGRRRGSTTEQLRNDIDTGRTGDKVPVVDPAASPLGTDDEAAGTPPTPARVDLARRTERETVAEPRPPGDGASVASGWWIWLIGAVILAAAAAIFFYG